MATGMSVMGLSPAATALGLNNGYDQTAGESEEAKKKRLAALAASQRNLTGALGADSYSPAAMSLGLG